MNDSNFITAVVLSIAILVGFHYWYEKPQQELAQRQIEIQKQFEAKTPEQRAQDTAKLQPRDTLIKNASRVKIETPEVVGSIDLKGARFDDLSLVKYRETVDPNSPQIVLLSPAGSDEPHRGYFAGFGWLADAGANVALPTNDTVWKASSNTLTPDKPVRLTWDNGHGLTFERTVAMDDHYMFTVTDRVHNASADTVTLYPFGSITRQSEPHVEGSYVLHEGLLGVLDGTLKETKYKDLIKEPKDTFESTGGWLGFTDKFWLVTLIPPQDEKITATFTYTPSADVLHPEQGTFQTDFRSSAVSLVPGAVTERVSHLFAGAKRVSLLDAYGEKLGLPLFDRAIDFGWYYYLTKPFLYLIDWLGGHLGNLGLAIIVFTLMLKIVTLPLSLKSSRSMAKLKDLQPEMKALQDRYKEEPQKLQIEMMQLYKREKVSPVSGCVPMLIQIPIFFALYKVLYVGIEMRHAPLIGWVHDMSAPDPTSVLTGFGAVDWAWMPHLGVWPILMGISMYLQQKLSPQPTDQSQAAAFKYLPLIFTFMMSKVAVGLIFYWTVSNIMGIAQQWYVMHSTAKHRKT